MVRGVTDSFEDLMKLSFFAVQPKEHVEIFGYSYLRFDLPNGGELFLTRFGWSRMPAVLPENWFDHQRYANEGYPLPGGTGSVYRVSVSTQHGKPLHLVVKFARSGQDVPVFVADSLMKSIPEEEVRGASWNSPFEEFGLLRDLRIGPYGAQAAPDFRMRTKRPLGIYCPPVEYKEWQLGRDAFLWQKMDRALAHAQHGPREKWVELHPARLYVMLYEWVEGMNAEDCVAAGLIHEEEMIELSRRVIHDLERKGYRMLDIKPRHFILRPDGKGGVLRRQGKIVYALIDFELLKRTPMHRQWLEKQSRSA
jgi:hypothetical protein